MVWHTINCKHFMLMSDNYTGNIFLHLLSDLFSDQCFPVCNGENILD